MLLREAKKISVEHEGRGEELHARERHGEIVENSCKIEIVIVMKH